MEPPNKGHVGIRSFVLYREVSFIWRLKCTGIIGIGTSRFVLYREVFFIRIVLYRRFYCSYSISPLKLSIDNPDIGLMVFLGVGMGEVSHSCHSGQHV